MGRFNKTLMAKAEFPRINFALGGVLSISRTRGGLGMKAMVLEQFGQPMPVREMPDPACPPDGVIVRVQANGICRSDWHAWMGDWPHQFSRPHVLGHEFAGIVEEVGPQVAAFRVGDRVVVPYSQGDGTCEMCRAGFSSMCQNRKVVGSSYWGSYGQLVAVPLADLNVAHLPEEISFITGAGLGCRFVTAFHAIVDQAEVRPGEWVAIFGCGGVGLSAVHIARQIGARVIGVDIADEKLQMAQQLGAEQMILDDKGQAAQAIIERTHGGAHVSIDALGIAQTIQSSVMSLRKRGRHVQVGLTTQAENGWAHLPIDAITRNELRLIGSAGGMPAWRYPILLGMVASGTLAPERLVTRTVPIEEASSVIESMSNYATLGLVVVDRW